MKYLMRRLFIAVCCAVAVAAFHRCARAGALSPTTLTPNGGVGVQFGARSISLAEVSPFHDLLSRTYTIGAGGDSAVIANAAERYALTVGGNAIEVVATRAITAPAVAAAAVAVGGAAWVGWQTGSAIARALDLGDQSHAERVVPTAAGWMRDAGELPAEEQQVLAWRCRQSGGSFDFGSAQEACDAEVRGIGVDQNYSQQCDDGQYASMRVHRVAVQAESVSGDQYWFSLRETYAVVSAPAGCVGPVGSQDTTVHWRLAQGDVSSIKSCPLVIDALNPAWSRPKGLPAGSDGRCPTGRYSPGLRAEAEDAVMKGVKRVPGISPDLIADILTKGQPIKLPDSRHVDGPSSVTGQPQTVTTTSPDPVTGAPRTVSDTSTPTTNYHYDGDTINYTTTIVNIHNDGNNSTTTTTTTGGGTVPKDDDSEDPCVKNPDRIGCLKLGDPPSDAPHWDNKDVPFQVDDLGLPSGCPAPRVLQFRNWAPWTINYQPACSIAPVIRAGLLVMAAVSCAAFVAKGTA